MLCCGHVSLRPSIRFVRLSQVGVLSKSKCLNVGSHTEHHTRGNLVSEAKDLDEIPVGLPPAWAKSGVG